MKIGIAHFTDIHFTETVNLDDRIASCMNALKNDFFGASGLYFIISGDIAYSGKKAEYDLAKSFFGKLKVLLELQYKPLKVKFIIVPGNHDCNVKEKGSQLRSNSINSISYETIGNDNSVIDMCLAVQDDFWDFYSNYNPLPSDKLFYQIRDNINGCNLCFHCLNTSWISQIDEKAGKLFFPVRRYDNISQDEDDTNNNINIGVFHHPYNWFTPSGNENNKREMEGLTERIASVHFIGHEHENEHYHKENMHTGDKINLLSGKVFYDSYQPDNSGFQTVVVELGSKIGKLKNYIWNKSIYDSQQQSQDVSFGKGSSRKFQPNQQFLDSLDEIKIPLKIGDRSQVRLSEIFVFPDLDSTTTDIKVLDLYIDSARVLLNERGHCVIGGEDQVGKTSLLYITYLKKYNEGKYPLFLSGNEIKELDLDKTLKRVFKRQYFEGETLYEAYSQLDISKKVLLVDDFQNCNFSANKVYHLLKEAMAKFELVILTIDSANSLLPVIQAEFKDMDFYKIKPLGYSKRNELITSYLHLKSDETRDNFDDLIKETFDKVGNVLGDKLIPSYPVFILSILQALDYSSLRQNETSFGYCYQTLIHYSLHKSNVKNEDIDTYFNLLSELAFDFVKNEKEVFSETELMDFYIKYKSKYIAPSYERAIDVLKTSKILIFEEDGVQFGYNYILYYLSAKKIADIIHTSDGKEIIQKFFKGMHIEKNGNILVFITHHTKDISFIEESLLNSMVVLAEYPPITLGLDDPFYDHIKEIAMDVSKDILELNKNPREEREKQLKMLDEHSKGTLPHNDNDDEILRLQETDESLVERMNAVTLPFKQSYRSIEIIGQIIRNRKGSLEMPQLKQMIKEAYTTGFRTISYSSQLLIAAKNQIIIMLNEDDEILNSSKNEIEKSVNDFVQMSSYESCVSVFSKLMSTVGIKDLRELFTEAGIEMNTPAAKLLSFGINSYYGVISERDLRNIVNEFKGNPVVLKMLRSRVKSYVYGKNLDIRVKQKFASLLGMTISPTRPGLLTSKR